MFQTPRLRSNESLGFIFVVIAGLGFGFLGIFGKLGFQAGLSVGELLTFRFIAAALVMGLFGLLFKPRDLLLNRRQILTSSLLGMFGYASFSTLYFKSIEGLSVGIAAMLLFCFPFLVVIGEAIFFQKKITRIKAFSLVLCIGGLVLLIAGPELFSPNSSTRAFSDSALSYYVFAGLAALAYAVYVLVSGRYQSETPAIGSSFFVMLAAGITLLVYNYQTISFEKIYSHQILLLIFGMAIICTVLPICFFLLGLQRLSSGTASLIITIEPVVAALAGFVLLDEKLGPIQILGSAIVISGIILIRRSEATRF